MKLTPLSPAQREQFDTEGFLIVRNALGKDEIARLMEAGGRLQPPTLTDDLNTIEQQFLGAPRDEKGRFLYGGSHGPLGAWCCEHGVQYAPLGAPTA